MKAFVIHDTSGRIRSIAFVGETAKLQGRPEPGPGYRVVELELPIPVGTGDLRSTGFHATVRELMSSHKVIRDELVAIEAKG